MKRITLALAFAVVTICGLTPSKTAHAQEILLEGPLAGAPAVRKLVQYRELRFSAGLQFAYTFPNKYMHNLLMGGRLEFNITDWVAIGAVGYYSVNIPTSLTDYISTSQNIGGEPTEPADSNFPSYTGAGNFEDQVALLKGMYLGQLAVVPFRGKMSMFEKLFVAIDGSIFVGGGVVHLDERADCEYVSDADTSCGTKDNPIINRTTRFAPTFTWGVGFMAYFSEWFAVNLEYRMTPFKWNAGGTDESGNAAATWAKVGDRWIRQSTGKGDYPDSKINADDRSWNLNQSIALGAIFYFPFEPSYTE